MSIFEMQWFAPSPKTYSTGLGSHNVVVVLCTYTKRYGSTDGSDLMRRGGNVDTVEVGIIEMVGGRSNGSMRNIRSGPKGGGSDSRMVQGHKKNFLRGLAERIRN